MLSTNYLVHLYFDYDHNIHYTDTLLALEPDAYLWYLLKIYHGFSAALFLDRECDELKVQTFDGFSKSMTEKKSIFSSIIKSENEDSVESCSQIMNKDFSLEDLMKIPDRKELKGKKIAFVLSLEALNYLYGKSDDKTLEKLRKRIETPEGKSIVVIKIPPHPSKIKEAFLEESSVLPKVSKKIRMVLNGAQEPIMDAIWRQMREQIILGYRLDDAFNMLTRIAMEKREWSDSPEELKRQASYLQLSYNNYGRFITAPAESRSNSVYIKHGELYEMLKNSQMRSRLREQVKSLTGKYPGCSMEEAMRKEGLLPDVMTSMALLEYDDPLVRNIKSLKVPESFSANKSYNKWVEQLDAIKRNFTTFWNKPQNFMSSSMAEFFYNYAKKTGGSKDDNTFGDALEMLYFCSEQLCADTDKCENLAVIFDYGKNMVGYSENIFNIFRKHEVSDIHSFKMQYSYVVSLPDDDMYSERKLDMKKDGLEFQRYYKNRSTLKNGISCLISEMKKNRISENEMNKIRFTIASELEREIQDIETQIQTEEKLFLTQKSAADKPAPKMEAEMKPLKKAVKREEAAGETDIEEELFSGEYSEEESGKHEAPKLRDKNFAEKLLGKTLY